ncbi:MAG: PhoH family protein [Planctomycetota bacterium]
MDLTIPLPAGPARLAVTGPADRHLKLIRDALDVVITDRGEALRIAGQDEQVGRAARVLEQLTSAAAARKPIATPRVLELITEVSQLDPTPAAAPPPPPVDAGRLDVYLTGRAVKPKTPGQRRYVHAILEHDLTICTGPAGTGKTYLATAVAAALLKRGHVRKLVLVRPAVEAGERLGFLPGTMQEKVNPYLRPLLDALHDMMDFNQVERFMAADLIEIIPLAFMRGRTLNDAMIILDEAQNATRSQMLMFLTRLGHGSRMVVTGDTSQTDLDDPTDSGLLDAVRRLGNVNGVAAMSLSGSDIVRHDLVQRVVEAYGDQDGR